MLDNFSWIEKNVLAASAIPHKDSHFEFLEEQGIKVIINLTSDPTLEKYSDKFELEHLYIEDFGVPDDDLVMRFWNICKDAKKEGKAVLVHCFGGCGRTGTILALWVLLSELHLTVDDAIRHIRLLRPCSLETEDQEIFIADFYARYKNQGP